MIHRVMALAPVVAASISLLTLPAAHAQDVKLPPTMTFTAYDTGTAGFNIAVAVGKMMKDKYGTDLRVLPAGNDVARLSPLRAGRGDVIGDGIRQLFRAGRRVRIRRQGMGTAGPAAGAVHRRLQRRFARRGEGHRRQGGQGPQGQARRLRRRLAGAEPELAGDPGVRRPEAERRQVRRVLQLRRDVEGPDQQRRRRRLRDHDHRPRQGSRDIAARHCLAAAAAQRQCRMGTGAEGRIVLLPPHGDLRRRHPQGQADRNGNLSVSDLRGVRHASTPTRSMPSPRR